MTILSPWIVLFGQVVCRRLYKAIDNAIPNLLWMLSELKSFLVFFIAKPVCFCLYLSVIFTNPGFTYPVMVIAVFTLINHFYNLKSMCLCTMKTYVLCFSLGYYEKSVFVSFASSITVTKSKTKVWPAYIPWIHTCMYLYYISHFTHICLIACKPSYLGISKIHSIYMEIGVLCCLK